MTSAWLNINCWYFCLQKYYKYESWHSAAHFLRGKKRKKSMELFLDALMQLWFKAILNCCDRAVNVTHGHVSFWLTNGAAWRPFSFRLGRKCCQGCSFGIFNSIHQSGQKSDFIIASWISWSTHWEKQVMKKVPSKGLFCSTSSNIN